jgi:hypothetical protein
LATRSDELDRSSSELLTLCRRGLAALPGIVRAKLVFIIRCPHVYTQSAASLAPHHCSPARASQLVAHRARPMARLCTRRDAISLLDHLGRAHLGRQNCIKTMLRRARSAERPDRGPTRWHPRPSQLQSGRLGPSCSTYLRSGWPGTQGPAPVRTRILPPTDSTPSGCCGGVPYPPCTTRAVCAPGTSVLQYFPRVQPA